MKNLKDIIKAIAENQALQGFVKVGKVIGVKDNVAEVEPIDTPAVVSVRLKVETSKQDGFTIEPEAGSLVLFLMITDHDGILLHADQIKQVRIQQGQIKLTTDATGIFLNGDGLGGIVKGPELKAQANKNKAVLDAIMGVLNGSPIPEPGNSAPSALQTALKAALVGKTTGSFDNLENPKVKHG